MEIIKNRVAESGLITIDLQTFLPKDDIVLFDIKNYLFRGMILREKDFREALKNTDWQQYAGKNVGIFCSADAIIPMWAYMLLITYLQPIVNFAAIGDTKDIEKLLLLQNINAINVHDFVDKRIVIKGCGDKETGAHAYAELTKVLLPYVKSMMYGEPCSTVPVYKKKQDATKR